MKEDFATEVVENSGINSNEIIKDPAGVLGEYWYTNLKEAVDFLDDGIAVTGVFLSLSHADGLKIYTTAEELRRGLTALKFQDSVVASVYRTHTPRPDWLGHRDIFSWGEKLVTTLL